MRVALTGTPGTGKTTAARIVADRLPQPSHPVTEVVHVNDHVESAALHSAVDEDRDSLVVDLEALATWADSYEDVLFESHLAHHLSVDRVVVLRCAPAVLEDRLRERGMDPASIEENAASEALDVILAETVDHHGTDTVYEVETTDRSPETVADALEDVLADRLDPTVGTVDYTGYLE